MALFFGVLVFMMKKYSGAMADAAGGRESEEWYHTGYLSPVGVVLHEGECGNK